MYLHPRNNQKLYDPHFTSVLSVLLSQSPVAAYVVHELSLEEEQESKLVQVVPSIIAQYIFRILHLSYHRCRRKVLQPHMLYTNSVLKKNKNQNLCRLIHQLLHSYLLD